MHALMSAVLLRFTGFDEFGVNAEPNPPCGEQRETAEGVGGEGDAVVRPDTIRQAIFLENPSKNRLSGIDTSGE